MSKNCINFSFYYIILLKLSYLIKFYYNIYFNNFIRVNNKEENY